MNPKRNLILGYALLGSVLTFSIYGIGQSLASGNHEEYERKSDSSSDDDYQRSKLQHPPLYLEECGSCHMAYPAPLLPTKSWKKIMLGLDNHFGESAELDKATSKAIENYLIASGRFIKYRKMSRNLGNRLPLRITKLPYFIHEHDEIPSRFIQGNDKVGSLSQCNACHKWAEQGDFDEDRVFIPGVGRWDD